MLTLKVGYVLLYAAFITYQQGLHVHAVCHLAVRQVLLPHCCLQTVPPATVKSLMTHVLLLGPRSRNYTSGTTALTIKRICFTISSHCINLRVGGRSGCTARRIFCSYFCSTAPLLWCHRVLCCRDQRSSSRTNAVKRTQCRQGVRGCNAISQLSSDTSFDNKAVAVR